LNDFLFVAFAGKKQRKQVGKHDKFEKKSTWKWWRHFKKFGKMHKFWSPSLGLEFQAWSQHLGLGNFDEVSVLVSKF